MLGIIIPAYNRVDKLREALESLKNQTMKRFIVYVVDDASTEDLKSVCDEYNKIMNVVYIRSAVNLGPGAARMRGLAIARANNMELVMFLDSDDILLPHAVQALTYEINHGKFDIISSTIIAEHQNQPFTFIHPQQGLTWFHGKIYRMSFLNKANIILPMGLRTNEDLAFNLAAFGSTKLNAYIETQTYIWRDVKDSLTRLGGTKEFVSVKGEDYIRAIHFATFYLTKNVEDYNPIQMSANIINCYNYYQMMVCRGIPVTPEIDQMVFEMLTLPKLEPFWKPIKCSATINQNVWGGAIIDKQYYLFPQTFKEWFETHGGKIS